MLEAHEAGRLIALRTSGSTGRPRSVVRSTGSWFQSFPHVASRTGLTAEARVWLPGPLGATMNLFAAALARWMGAELSAGAADATHAHLTPMAFERAIGVLPPGAHVTVAGDRLPRPLHDRAVAAGLRVSHYYGSSELSFVAWGTHAEDLRAFPAVEVEVRDHEIWVRSPYLCVGYAGPAGALRTDQEGFATVGDRGALVDGRLVVAGRGADTVTTGGASVWVADVEAVLRPVVSGDVAVTGLPHATLGQVVAAVLTDRADVATARAAAEDQLAPAQRPRRWFWRADLPTTAAGKLDRDALPRLAATSEELTAVTSR